MKDTKGMMNSDWTEIESILDIVLQLPAGEREKYICKNYSERPLLRKELVALLNSIEKSQHLFDEAELVRENMYGDITAENAEKSYQDSLIGTKIGNYRIVELISSGGMGSIYFAKRDDGMFDRCVALKLIRRGMDTPNNIARFEKERNILAGLNHANIANLIDGGVTDFGMPYLVMEFVDGKPIDEYADEKRLTLKERIKLIITICNAVQYAHNNMVIHRDLKPANIFVNNNGKVKILDFGIAKLVEEGISKQDEQTHQTQFLLTPNYASPEQLLGNKVSTASDTYAIGVLLYRLLTGCSPFDLQDKNLIQLQQIILNQSPPPPSVQLSRLQKTEAEKTSPQRSESLQRIKTELKRDLDAIILKALRKEQERRYLTASALADDLGRYLNNKPVKAHSGNFRYKTGKLLRRNYKAVTAAAMFLIAAVSFGFWHTAKIADERNLAQQEAAKAAQVSSLLFELFEASEPGEALGDTISAQELLQRGLKRAELLDEQPLLKAQMYNVIGRVFYKLGNFKEAKPLLEGAISIQKQHYGPGHPETAISRAALGALIGAQGDYKAAAEILSESLDFFDKNRASDLHSLASIKSDLAYTLRRQGNFKEADRLFRETYDVLLRNLGPNHIQTQNIKHSIGSNLFNMGYYEEAEQIYREVLSIRRELLGDDHPDLAISKNSLAALLMLLGRFDESEKLFYEAYNIRLRSLGPAHPRTMLTQNNLAILKRDKGSFVESEKLFENVLAIRRLNLGEDHASTAITRFALGELYILMNLPEDALSQFELALPIFEESFTGSHSFSVRTRMNIGYANLMIGNTETAGDYIVPAYESLIEIHNEGSIEHAIGDHHMARYYFETGDIERAHLFFEKALLTFREREQNPTSRHQLVLKDFIMAEGLESDLAEYLLKED